jgi:hypothetical protein
MLNEHLDWPRVGQVYRLERKFDWVRQGKVFKSSCEIEYGITIAEAFVLLITAKHPS